MTRWT